MSREPSMEEILSSIRRVIARDEPVSAANVPPPLSPAPLRDAPQPEALHSPDAIGLPDDDDDVLDLTDASTDDLGEAVAADPPLPPSTPSLVTPAPAGATAAPALVAEEPAAASRQSLDVLAALLASSQPANPAPGSATASDLTVHAMVDAALRPMLKTWLDANLPGLVERLVAREIARITGSRL